ncbi:hypothetical protein ACQ86N_01985 [Puia sp. P3]|uniref:hypothetical protein n=1 Tax=Puia sp. P3 TaxID=3423952 RepID=UPI003D67F780
MFFDFGPIFEDWEADFGRTYVIGSDPTKHKLNHGLYVHPENHSREPRVNHPL